MEPRRFDIKALLRDPATRRELSVRSLRFIQAVEGRDLTYAEAQDVYDRVATSHPVAHMNGLNIVLQPHVAQATEHALRTYLQTHPDDKVVAETHNELSRLMAYRKIFPL